MLETLFFFNLTELLDIVLFEILSTNKKHNY